MAHKVKLNVRIPELGKIDTCFEIYSNGKKLGELKISKGGVDYTPAGKQIPIKKNWAKIHKLMTSD